MCCEVHGKAIKSVIGTDVAEKYHNLDLLDMMDILHDFGTDIDWLISDM